MQQLVGESDRVSGVQLALGSTRFKRLFDTDDCAAGTGGVGISARVRGGIQCRIICTGQFKR